jgi:hypothetical protein
MGNEGVSGLPYCNRRSNIFCIMFKWELGRGLYHVSNPAFYIIRGFNTKWLPRFYKQNTGEYRSLSFRYEAVGEWQWIECAVSCCRCGTGSCCELCYNLPVCPSVGLGMCLWAYPYSYIFLFISFCQALSTRFHRNVSPNSLSSWKAG